MNQGIQLPSQHENVKSDLEGSVNSRRSCYYLLFTVCLVCNVALITLYAHQVYTPHTDCFVNGHNVTLNLSIAFRLGLSSMVVEFLTLTCVLIPQYSQRSNTFAKTTWQKDHQGFFWVYSSILDWTVKFLVIIAATIQLMMT